MRAWGGPYLWARSAKRGKSSQSSNSEVHGLKDGRDSWWMFIGEEIDKS